MERNTHALLGSLLVCLPLVSRAQLPDSAARWTPRVALKTDLFRPIGVNLASNVLNSSPTLHWPFFVAAEVGLTRRMSVEVAGHYRGGFRHERIDGVAGQLRRYVPPSPDMPEVQPYFCAAFSYRRWQNRWSDPTQVTRLKGAGLGGGVVLVLSQRRVKMLVDVHSSLLYQWKRYMVPADRTPARPGTLGQFLGAHLRPDLRLCLGLQI